MTTPSSNTDGRELKTDDLTLASLLYMHGYTDPKIHRQADGSARGRAVWVFSGDDMEYITDIVRDYKSGTSTVEPKSFMKAVGMVRSNLYKFLGHNPGRVSSN